jgi:hypothetical protein
MEYLSLKGSEQLFEMWANADPNIESFGFGQLYNQNGEPKVRQKYKGIWIQHQQTNITSEQTLTRTYQILIYDLVFDENHTDIISDCEEIAHRLLRWLDNADEVFQVTGLPVIRPFVDRFFDDVSGVIIDIEIEYNKVQSECSDPLYVFSIIKNNWT